MDTAEFQTATVARAAGVEAMLLKAWLARAKGSETLADLSRDVTAPAKPGLRRDAARLFSRRSAYRFAVLGALHRFGMSPQQGLKHATLVCDFPRDRVETLRFPKGQTYLVIDGNNNSAILNLTNETTADEVLHPVFPNATSEALLMIDIGRLLFRADAVLDSEKQKPR